MNAGVYKAKSLELLVSNNKTVLISTHYPFWPCRWIGLVIKNDRIFKYLKTRPDEKKHLQSLKKIDFKLTLLWNQLRVGEGD